VVDLTADRIARSALAISSRISTLRDEVRTALDAKIDAVTEIDG